jgi:hypothetical protein
MVASFLVVVSLFLPWVKFLFVKKSGWGLLVSSFNMASRSSTSHATGLTVLTIAVLGPAVLHGLNLLFLARRSALRSLAVTLTPVVVWVMILIRIMVKTGSTGVNSLFKTGQIGMFATVLGMLAGLTCSIILFMMLRSSGRGVEEPVPVPVSSDNETL